MIGTVKRTYVIATSTFTQLARMKAFWFLAIFAVMVVGLQFFSLPTGSSASSVAVEELRMLKSTSMGMMSIFTIIFAVAATGLLLPRDLEDRTLYTILCKPVPRFDYLAGKYIGVLLTIFLALLVMDVIMILVLNARTETLLADRIAIAQRFGWTDQELALDRAEILAQSNTWSLQFGVLAIFLKAMVTAGIALLISTFSRSTLFTIVIGLLIFFIGHFSGEARDFWLNQQEDLNPIIKYGTHIVSIIFPDFRLFNVIEGAIDGRVISSSIMLSLIGISCIYAAVYLLLSWFTFAKKEF